MESLLENKARLFSKVFCVSFYGDITNLAIFVNIAQPTPVIILLLLLQQGAGSVWPHADTASCWLHPWRGQAGWLEDTEIQTSWKWKLQDSWKLKAHGFWNFFRTCVFIFTRAKCPTVGGEEVRVGFTRGVVCGGGRDEGVPDEGGTVLLWTGKVLLWVSVVQLIAEYLITAS